MLIMLILAECSGRVFLQTGGEGVTVWVTVRACVLGLCAGISAPDRVS